MLRARRFAPLMAVVGVISLAAAACSSAGTPEAVATVTVQPSGGSGAAQTDGSAGSSGTASTDQSGIGSSGVVGSTTPSVPTTTVVPPPVAKVVPVPAFGSKGLSPSDPITITVQKGTIAALELKNPEGRVVKGDLSNDKTTWKLAEVLGYNKKYTVSGSATGTDGKTVPIKGTFTTVEPTKTVRTTISPGDGKTVGVAAPVIIGFGMEPKDRAAMEKLVSITTVPKVEGAWAWINHDGGEWGLDWRPKAYWPTGTKVHVAANVYGFKFASGAYGAEDLTSDFTIGRNQVTYADVNSHELVVKQAGQEVARYPASFGRGTDQDTTTRSGIHVINEKFDKKLMSNPKYGYVDVLERFAVRISNNGEFIHANPETVGSQGNTNVSHGCVNLSLENAQKYYDSVIYGDPVEVTGTNVNLDESDGDIFDWAIPWDVWVTLSGKNS